MGRVSWNVMLDTAARASDVRRQFVRYLQSQTGSNATFDAELVFGELAASIVRNEPGPAKIVVDVAGEEAIVTVEGPAPAAEEVPALPDDLSPEQQGMFLIRTLARDFFVDRSPRGQKTTLVLGLRHLQTA